MLLVLMQLRTIFGMQLMSLDLVDMEILLRSGTEKEHRCARKIIPVIKNSHFLLCTLLMCNACSMEALPIFLDRLADPITAIMLSVTAVLFFGEIIPQAICTRWGPPGSASMQAKRKDTCLDQQSFTGLCMWCSMKLHHDAIRTYALAAQDQPWASHANEHPCLP